MPEQNLSEAANQGSVTDEGWRVRADGSEFWANVVITPIYDDGTLTGYAKVTRDMTERRERERRLRTFRKAVDAAGHSIYYTDTDGTIEYVNPAFEETTGYSAEEAIGQTPRLLKSGAHDQSFYEELWNTILKGDTWRGEIVNTTKDGDRYIVEQTIAPVEDESGEIAHLAAVNADITERKDREHRYDAVFNQTYQFTGLLEPDGTLIEANESALTFGGLDRAEVVGKKVWNAFWFQHDEAAEQVREAVERARDGEFVRQEFEAQGADRAAIIDFSIRPVTDDYGEITYLIPEGRDITDRVKVERETQRNRDHLAALNHVNTVVHEITNLVIKQSTREEIKRTVCKAFADVDSYECACIVDVNGISQTMTVRTSCSVEGNRDGSPLSIDPKDERSEGPTMRAFRTGTIQVRNGVDTDSGRDLLADPVDTHGIRSVAAIPLVHDDMVSGVLNVYTDRPNAFEDHEQAVLGQLGEIVGQAIAATERKQALMSDEIIELEYHVPDVLESMGVDVAADGRFTLDDVVATSDGGYLMYGTMTPDARGTIDALTEQHPHYWGPVIVSSEEEKEESIRFQVRVTEFPLQSGVVSEGGFVEELLFEDGDFDLRVYVPPSGDVSAITEAVEGTYPTAQLLAKRQFPRSHDSMSELRQSLSEELTDRQQAVLEAAYHRGYFEWPRDASGEAVADSLGIAPPTFSQHLRKAEKTVVESLFSFTTQPNGHYSSH